MQNELMLLLHTAVASGVAAYMTGAHGRKLLIQAILAFAILANLLGAFKQATWIEKNATNHTQSGIQIIPNCSMAEREVERLVHRPRLGYL